MTPKTEIPDADIPLSTTSTEDNARLLLLTDCSLDTFQPPGNLIHSEDLRVDPADARADPSNAQQRAGKKGQDVSLSCCYCACSQNPRLHLVTSLPPPDARCRGCQDAALDSLCFWGVGIENDDNDNDDGLEAGLGEDEKSVLRLRLLDTGTEEDWAQDLDELDTQLVISRTALPKGSVQFEQVLGEVAPGVRGLEESSLPSSSSSSSRVLSTVVIRSQSAVTGTLEDQADGGACFQGQGQGHSRQRVSWADHRGLPLKSVIYFEKCR